MNTDDLSAFTAESISAGRRKMDALGERLVVFAYATAMLSVVNAHHNLAVQ